MIRNARVGHLEAKDVVTIMTTDLLRSMGKVKREIFLPTPFVERRIFPERPWQESDVIFIRFMTLHFFNGEPNNRRCRFTAREHHDSLHQYSPRLESATSNA